MSSKTSIQYQDIEPFFSALGNKTRFEIMRLVSLSPRTVTDICEALKCNQSKISNDLKCLRECGYVHVEKRGNERIYSVDNDTSSILYLVASSLEKLARTRKGCTTCCENNGEDKRL